MDPYNLYCAAINSAQCAKANFLLPDAVQHYNNALYYLSAIPSPGLLSDTLLGRAGVYIIMGKFAEAVQDIARGVKCSPPTCNPVSIVRIVRVVTCVYICLDLANICILLIFISRFCKTLFSENRTDFRDCLFFRDTSNKK